MIDTGMKNNDEWNSPAPKTVTGETRPGSLIDDDKSGTILQYPLLSNRLFNANTFQQ